MNPKHLTEYGLSWLLVLSASGTLAQASSAWGTVGAANSDPPNTFWGAETNGVRVGLYVNSNSNTPSSVTLTTCTPIVRYSGTNTLWLYLPPLLSRFQMTLMDEKDRLVATTEKGKRLGEPLTHPFALTTGVNYAAGYTGCPPFHPGHSELLGNFEFHLQDYFAITNPGKYHLEFQMKVIWFPPGWKGTRKSTSVPMVPLPPIHAEIEIARPQR